MNQTFWHLAPPQSIGRLRRPHLLTSLGGTCSPGPPATTPLYTNDLTENLSCSAKLFAGDTSLFTIVQDPNSAASDLNHDLDLIRLWAYKWRMSFNPDPRKQAVELIFSKKTAKTDHPPVLFNDAPVMKVDQHKHLGVILNPKLSFSAHI